LHTARESALPAPTIVHLPGDEGSAQLRQAPVHALSQQTPSTHRFELHSPAAVQLCPFCFFPQVPLLQAIPLSQSASVVQVTVQAPSAHMKGEQLVRPGARHVPRPSQVAAVLSRVPEQAGGAHSVSTG
jgi:hypothetical protein